MNLREWRRSKGWNQSDAAAKLRIAQNTYSAWETGRSEIPADGERDLRKMGYTGPLPRQEAPAASPADYVTREDFWKLVGRLETLERAFEKQGEIVRDLVRESEESRPRGLKG